MRPYPRLGLNPFSIVADTGDDRLLSANPRRWAILLRSVRSGLESPFSRSVNAISVDTSIAGVKLSFTSPAGFSSTVRAMTFFQRILATVVVDFEAKISGVVSKIAQFTAKGIFQGPLVLAPLDLVQFNVTTPIATSTSDFTIFGDSLVQTDAYTVSFGGQPAVTDKSLIITPGAAPTILTQMDFG